MLRWKSLLADALTKRRLPKGVRRKQRAGSERSRRMRLETLEDRRMLATITVNSNADNMTVDNMVTLREAIQAANTNMSVDGSRAGEEDVTDTITFDPTVFTGGANSLIRLNGTELAIAESLTIDASGAVDVTITGDMLGNDTVVTGTNITDVDQSLANVATSLDDNSRVINFSAMSGDLTLNSLTITGGRTTGDTDIGGGIFANYSNLSLTSSTVSGNSTTGDYAFGGGIYTSSGAVTLTSSTVSGNSTAGAGVEAGADGGGIFTTSGAVTLKSSTVSGNSTAGAGADGGGIFTFSGEVSLTGSTVSGNSTTGNRADGGGIFTLSGDVSLTGSTVSGNNTTGNGADGGGIFAFSGNVSLTNSTIFDNAAGGIGGGVFVADSAINPEFTIVHSIIAGNSDDGTAPDLRPDPDSTFTVNFSLIGDNQGTGLAAAPVGMPDANGNLIGTSASPINPELDPLADNGGPTLTHALAATSPAIDAGDPNFDPNDFTPPLEFDQRGTGFSRVVDGGINGLRIDIGAFEVQTILAPPPNLFVDILDDENDGDFSAGDLSLREAIAQANDNPGTDTITFNPAVFTGGANSLIRLNGTELEITESLIIDASGATEVTITGDTDDDDVTLAGNITDVGASFGGTAGDPDDLLDDNSRVINFSAMSGDLTLNSLTITGGRTTGSSAEGGGIFTYFGAVSLTSSTVSGNSTMGNGAAGGGIYTYSGAVSLTNSTVSGNGTIGRYAPGGGISTLSGAVSLTNSTVSGNSTAGDNASGGGIFAARGAVSLTNSTIFGNEAGRVGGGVFVFDLNTNPSFTIENSIIAGNSDNGTAPDLRPDPDSMLTANFSLIENISGLSAAQQSAFNELANSNVNGDPLLGPLADNGGPTQTHALLLGSPAIDAGDPAVAANPAESDQRGTGFLRVIDGGVAGLRIDMGAFEFVPPEVVVMLNAQGELEIADTGITADADNDLTIAQEGNELVITSATRTLGTAVSGASGSGTSSVRVPVASIAGNKIIANLGDGDDRLTVDFTNGRITLPIDYNGQAPAASPGDSLRITGGTADTITYTFENASDGGVAIDFGGGADSTIAYTGLEPIVDNSDATHRIFTFNGGDETITLTDDGTANDNMSLIDSTAGESVTFLNPTASLTINAGSGVDTVNVDGIDAQSMIPSLTVNGDAEGNTIDLTGIASGTFGNITLNGGAGDDTITGSEGDDTIDGGAGDDMVDGRAGNDTIIATQGADTLVGDVGEDGFTVAPATMPINVDGDNPTVAPGDTLTVDLVGTTGATLMPMGGSAGQITFTSGEAPINFQEIENLDVINGTLTIPPPAPIDTGAGDDNILVTLDGNEVVVTVNAVETFRQNLTFLVGPLVINGEAGNDTLTVDSSNGLVAIDNAIRFNGGSGNDRLNVVQVGGPDITSESLFIGSSSGHGIHELTTAATMQRIEFDGLEPFTTNVAAPTFNITSVPNLASLLQDDNQINYEQGTPAMLGPNAGRVTVDNFEPIEFINKMTLVIDAGAGDDTIVLNNANTPNNLVAITVNAGDGADEVRLESLPAGLPPTVNGDGGNDIIDGSGLTSPSTLSGGAGNDTITGGAGVDTISGGAGDDTFVDSPGSDAYDGGTGNDTLSFLGTIANDTIDIFQNAPNGAVGGSYGLNVTSNGSLFVNSIASTNPAQAPNNAANLPSVERLLINMREGNDAIRVGHAHSYGDNVNSNGVADQSIRIEVEGDAPNASDLLVVRDDQDGDTVIQRLGPDGRSGSLTVGALAPVDYSGIEQTRVLPIDPLTSGTGADGLGRLIVFKNDPFEANDTLQTATFLGAGPTINVDPTIDPGAGGAFEIPGDADFYQFVAQETGTLDFQLYFEPVPQLANGQPGLPGNGELNATFFGSDANPIAGIGTSGAQNILDGAGAKIGERITVPVVENQTYYVRIQGDTTDAINVYNFTAINVPAPIPELVDLVNTSDSGRNDTDDITNDTTPTFSIILDDDRIDAFTNLNLLPDNVDDNLQTANFDYGIEVFNSGVSIGFAFYTGAGNTWSFTAANGNLVEGDGNHISAAVWIRDRATPSTIDTYEMSEALQVTLDTIAPPISFGLANATNATDGLFDGSDTGVATDGTTFSDRITSDSDPTLWGIAEANTIVSLWLDANGDGLIQTTGATADIFLGQTVANPLDGNLAFPPGYWQISSAVDLNDLTTINATGGAYVRDGARPLLVTAQDQAGNPVPAGAMGAIGPAIGGTILGSLTIFLDTQGPQVTGVSVNIQDTGAEGGYDLFDPKPSVNGPTPLVNSLTIHFRDLPIRSDVTGMANDFLYPALDPIIAATIGNYSVVGDTNGPIVVTSATVSQAVRLSGTVTAAAAANSVTVTDAMLVAGTQVGDFIVFNTGNAAGLTRRITNVAGGALTIDAPFNAAQAGGDGFSIIPAASLVHAATAKPNTAVQATVTSTVNNATMFTAANLSAVAGAGDYIRFNTGNNAGQIRRITSTAGGGLTMSVDSALPSIPAAGDTFTLYDEASVFGPTATNTASVTLNFAQPLPDDRFTITVNDNLVDPVGNKLDGESNATTPTATPTFPTGDGVPGGAFVGRFTVDTRPEIAVWSAGTAWVDINGNLRYDPENIDATNRDINFQIGFASDNIFAGKFGVSSVTGLPTGFDTLAAYGRVGSQWRWLIDTNHNGTVSDATDININEPMNVNGLPVAGNFDNNLANGDEVGVFDGTRWFLDTNHDFQLDTVIAANYTGFPIVGDFNGDGNDDLGTYQAVTNAFGGNLFSIDTSRNGLANTTFRVGTAGGGAAGGFNGFPGVRERPVAADMNADGVDDIGLWLPDGSALNPGDQGEWIFLVSAGVNSTVLNRAAAGGGFVTFTPTPFGPDFSARLGNSFAWPIVGNFDPPVVATSDDLSTDAQVSSATESPAAESQNTTENIARPEESVAATETGVVEQPAEEVETSEATPEVEPVVTQPSLDAPNEPTEEVASAPDVPAVESALDVDELKAMADVTIRPVEIGTPPDVASAPAEQNTHAEIEASAEDQTAPASQPIAISLVPAGHETAPAEAAVETPMLPPETSDQSEPRAVSRVTTARRSAHEQAPSVGSNSSDTATQVVQAPVTTSYRRRPRARSMRQMHSEQPVVTITPVVSQQAADVVPVAVQTQQIDTASLETSASQAGHPSNTSAESTRSRMERQPVVTPTAAPIANTSVEDSIVTPTAAPQSSVPTTTEPVVTPHLRNDPTQPNAGQTYRRRPRMRLLEVRQMAVDAAFERAISFRSAETPVPPADNAANGEHGSQDEVFTLLEWESALD